MARSGRPLTFSMGQSNTDPDSWKPVAEFLRQANADGLKIKGQVLGRAVGFVLGHELTLNPFTIRLLNAVIQMRLRHAPPFGHYEGFFYPLDVIAHWNRGYGHRGFAQYQFVIPFADGARRLRDILGAIRISSSNSSVDSRPAFSDA